MKKTVIILLAILFTVPAFPQDESEPETYNNVIKANTLTLIIATGSIFYERRLTDITAAQLGVGFMGYKIEETKLSGLFLTPEFKFYIRKNALDGFFMAPYLRYMNLSYDNDNGDGALRNFGGGISFGRQWIFKKGLALELFFGGHYGDSSFKITRGEEPADLKNMEGFRTRIGFCIGFAF